MSKATKATMDALHGALASAFKTILEEGKTVVDKETGAPVKITPDAATLSAIRQFLKDNGVEAAAGTSPILNDVARRALPFHTDADEHGLPQ